MSEPEPDRRGDRRDFLRRCARTGAALVLTAGAGAWLWNRRRPGDFGAMDSQMGLPDFSLPEQRGKLAIVEGGERRRSFGMAMEALGGMAAFVAPGDRVVVKVNAAFASPPMLGATTHPELVEEVVRHCLAAGAARVIVTDNPINDPASCFSLSEIGRATEAAGGTLALPTEDSFRPLTVQGGELIRDWPALLGPLDGASKLIGVAPVKHHNRSGASLCIKNWYGLLGGRRNQFHQDIHNILKELALMVRPTLVVLDGTTAMLSNGPTGGSVADLKPTHTMIVGTDPVAADTVGARLLGKGPADLPWLGKAAELGCGTTEFEVLAPVRLRAG